MKQKKYQNNHRLAGVLLPALMICLLLTVSACGSLMADLSGEEEAYVLPEGLEHLQIDQPLLDDEAFTHRITPYTAGAYRPSVSTQDLTSQRTKEYATEFLLAYGEALVQASQEQPDNALAIEDFALVGEPKITHFRDAAMEPFAFVCKVQYRMRPLYPEVAAKLILGNRLLEGEEEGWLQVQRNIVLAVADNGDLNMLYQGSSLEYFQPDYIPIGLIREAQALYDCFELDSTPLLKPEGATLELGNRGYRVGDFPDLSYLDARLREYFSTEVIAELLADDFAIEQDGVLYIQDGARGADISYQGERWYVKEYEAGKRFVYTAEVDYWFTDEPISTLRTETFDYVLELTKENGWVFSRFDYYL